MSGPQNPAQRYTNSDQPENVIESPVIEVCVRHGHSLEIPDQIVTPFLERGLKRVHATANFEGKSLDFHAAIQRYNQVYVLTFGKRYQKELGLFPNDYFELQLREDQSKYGAPMPEELQAVLEADPAAAAVFEALTAGKKRSIIYMIDRYKNSETRIDKSLRIIENLKRGIRDGRELLK